MEKIKWSEKVTNKYVLDHRNMSANGQQSAEVPPKTAPGRTYTKNTESSFRRRIELNYSPLQKNLTPEPGIEIGIY